MPEPSLLTDRTALMRNRTRALRLANPAMFLQLEAVLEIKERLIEVNRTFTSVAIVTPFAEIWRDFGLGVTIVPDDDVLTLESEAYDLVIHSMSLHWSNDPVGQLIQCKRALKPDGLFVGACFGGSTLSELRAAMAEAEISITNGLSPRVLPMGEIREFGSLLQRAGFAMPVADTITRLVSYADMTALMRDLRAMGENNALAQRSGVFAPRGLFDAAAKIYADAFGVGDGRINATFELIFLTGWAPDESQQKPLKPGSANVRLADALNTSEHSLPDAPKKRI